MNESFVASDEYALMPYQRTFVDGIFDPSARRIHVLHAETGSGKSAALVECVSRVQREQPKARILLIVPSALGEQFADRLRMRRVPLLQVDRYRFREMTDIGGNASPWPEGIALIVSMDFARQADVRASLESVTWDLLIVDEPPMSQGSARWKVIVSVAKKAARVVIATGIATPIEGSFDEVSQDEVESIFWRRSELRDETGRNVAGPPPLLTEVSYILTNSEQAFALKVQQFCEEIDQYLPRASSFLSASLRGQLDSSPAAIESGLRQFSGKAFTASTGGEDDDSVESRDSDNRVPELRDYVLLAELSDAARELVTALEDISEDSKLKAVSKLLADLSEKRMPVRRTVILTKYLSTMFYLSVAIEDLGIDVAILHGGMSFEDRQAALLHHQSHGGVLLATRAIVRGARLAEFSDLVLYEIPDSNAGVEAVAATANMVGRSTLLNVWILAPGNFDRPAVDLKLVTLGRSIGRLS